VREVEVSFRGAECNQDFEQALPRYPLPRS
jgi:hypothetical protein